MFQCNFLNKFNADIREKVGDELLNQGLSEEYDWMLTKTEFYECPSFQKMKTTKTQNTPLARDSAGSVQLSLTTTSLALLVVINFR